jgi:hypothetical protein
MNKGCTGLQNIQLLRWCEEAGIQVSYNILWGFPGETVEDYKQLLDTLEFLTHLQPPVHQTQIAIHRYSPLFRQATSINLEHIRPREDYLYLFDPEQVRIPDIAYEHTADPPAGLKELEPYYEKVRLKLAQWRDSYHAGRNRLEYRVGPDFLRIVDSRTSQAAIHDLDRQAMEVYLFCAEKARTQEAIAEHLSSQGYQPERGWLADVLDQMFELRLIYREDGQHFSLALPHASCSARSSRTSPAPAHAGPVPRADRLHMTGQR